MNTTPSRSECEEIVGRLWPHLDGILPDSERDRVVAHLEGCTGCRSHYDFARAFLEAVRRTGGDRGDVAALGERVRRAITEAAR